ncbi:hypothetical protein TWF696_009402 [Orbilia brochopaga]|uniref:CENP-C homolog n=1 Tax=Orbilia brochopaga TaxID=3140254 RepID=A0AAV9UG07_9PEZI
MAYVANKKRENLHTDIGMVGRKTGFTVKSLPRNDDGMENMSAFFSSSPRPESEAAVPDDCTEDLLSDNDMDNDHAIVKSTGVPDLTPHVHDAPSRILLDNSASMDIEESSARSLADTLDSRRVDRHLTSLRNPYPGIFSPARRKSTLSSNHSPSFAPHSASSLPQLSQGSSSASPSSRRASYHRTHTSREAGSQPSHLDQGVEPEDGFTSSKENIPKTLEETASERTKQISSISKTQRGVATSTGLRSVHGSRLLTQGKRHFQSNVNSLEQPDNDDYELSIFDPVDRTEPTPTPPKKANSGYNITLSARLAKRADTSGSKYLDKRQGETIKPQSTIRDRKHVKQGQRVPRSESTVSAGSDTDDPSKEPGLSDIGDTEQPKATEGKSPLPKPLSPGQGNANNPENRSIATISSVDRLDSNLYPRKRAGRPKKSQTSFPNKAEPLAAPKQIAPKPSNKIPCQDVADISKDTADGGSSQNVQLSSEQPPLLPKRGRKRKADLSAPESESRDLPAPHRLKLDTRRDHASNKLDQQRDGKPAENQLSGTDTLESDRPKRSRIAPLQFWKNEKRVYTVNERRESGTAVSLTEEVIRIEDTPVTRPPKKSRTQVQGATARTKKTGKRGKRKALNDKDQEILSGSDTDDEDWEKVGKLVGMVKQWPSESAGAEDDEIEDEIAISRKGIEFKPIFGSDYLFAKTMGKEFMGCGILELQTGATKKLKSSGKMQLVFFVLEGKIEAEVNELGFRITRGGQFQVPRGNMYKISNPFSRTSRIFFAQACIPELELE